MSRTSGLVSGSFVAARSWPWPRAGCLVGSGGDTYTVSTPIACGMWADVCSATNRLQQPRAIKVLDTRKSQGALRRATTTLDEVQQEIAGLRATHGVHAVRDAVQAGDRVCLVLDYMHGNLAQLRNKLDAGCKRTLGRLALAQLAGDLHRMHRAGHVHNDLHMGNVLWRSDGVLAIADFGASSEVRSDGTTQAPQAPWLHAPPERFEAALHAAGHTSQADVWSLGLTIADIHAVRRRPVNIWAMVRMLWRYLWGAGPRALTRTADPAVAAVCHAQKTWRHKMLGTDGKVCMDRVGSMCGLTGNERKWARYYGAVKSADAQLCRFIIQRIHDPEPRTRATPHEVQAWALAVEPTQHDCNLLIARLERLSQQAG